MIDKYQQAFQEEAREILVELEAALLELNERPADPDLVGRVFRALHTIKGSGAMFGFDELSAFTHHIEAAFDRIRSGSLEAGPELIGLSLVAADQIKIMLDEAAGNGCADPRIAADILEKLRKLAGTSERFSPRETRVAATAKAAEAIAAPEGVVRDWRIRFRPGPEMLRYGANPLLLFRELRQMGSLRLEPDTSAVPAIAELDPQRCYLAWNIGLSTAAPREAIRDVFMFVEDSCELTIEAAAPAEAVTPASPLPPIRPPSQVPTEGSPVAEAAAAPPAFERRSNPARRSTDKPDSSTSIRVAANKLDQLVDLVGQLVTVQARLAELATRRDDREVQDVAEELESLTAQLRETSMGMRTLPMRSTFERFKRLVYDLGRTLHKQVELTFEGADTELDKTVIDQLHDPLMHLIRNSMDHGIEPPEVREAAGKPATGTIHLSARHTGAHVSVCVSDDGRGIDGEAVRARALERHLIAPEARLSESEIFSLILSPGFSTAREVSDVSGRGVGMDVVKRNVEALRGSIEIASRPGAGSTVTLRLPLTLAIIDGLLVRVGQTRFVIPLANAVECVELTRQDIALANGKQLANVRGEIIPYIRLSECLGMHRERPEREQVMVAETEHGRFGFVVDQVLGDHQTVIKNLGRLYRGVQVVSGATILGDGTVALILDLHRMAQNVIREGLATNHSRARCLPGTA
jgi:two-component system, chemotaxis family, sensor kinase CheA